MSATTQTTPLPPPLPPTQSTKTMTTTTTIPPLRTRTTQMYNKHTPALASFCLPTPTQQQQQWWCPYQTKETNPEETHPIREMNTEGGCILETHHQTKAARKRTLSLRPCGRHAGRSATRAGCVGRS